MCRFFKCFKRTKKINNVPSESEMIVKEVEIEEIKLQMKNNVKHTVEKLFISIADDKNNTLRFAFNRLKDNMELKKQIEYNNKPRDFCMICNKMCVRDEMKNIIINNLDILSCNKCDELDENELIKWFNSHQLKRTKEIEKTIKVRNKSFVLVKYENEDLDDAIDKFINMTGLDENLKPKIKKML